MLRLVPGGTKFCVGRPCCGVWRRAVVSRLPVPGGNAAPDNTGTGNAVSVYRLAPKRRVRSAKLSYSLRSEAMSSRTLWIFSARQALAPQKA